VDANPETTNAYKVLSMPTFMVFRAGEPVKAMVGARPLRRLLEELSDILENGS
jgi:thioredoxin